MTGAQIIVVEDERVVAKAVRGMLEAMGHNVIAHATTGERAIECVKTMRPDLILMDIKLEGKIDGVQAAKVIRKTCDAPIIFLTAYGDDQTLLRAKEIGPFGYVLKPFGVSHLRAAIEVAMPRAEATTAPKEHASADGDSATTDGDPSVASERLGQADPPGADAAKPSPPAQTPAGERQPCVACEFRCDRALVFSDAAAAARLLGLAEVAVGNAAKRQTAAKIEVSLSERNGAIVLEIRGKGSLLPEGDPSRDESYGLRRIVELAACTGASVRFERSDAEGFAVICELPTSANVVEGRQ